MRTTLSIVLGYLIFAISAVALFQLVHRDPHAPAAITFAIIATLYGIVFAAIAGWAAERLARRADLLAPIWVGILIALGATISLIATWRQAAHWSQWTAILLMAPAAIVGGWAARIFSR